MSGQEIESGPRVRQARAGAGGKERQTAASRRARVLELLAGGLTPAEAAAELGISPRTVRHYLADPGAREALRRLQDERLRQLSAQALAAAGTALETLRDIAGDPTAHPQARVAAAGKLLDAALRLVEAADLAGRVEALEAAARELQTKWRKGGSLNGQV